jgi:hypothetical protein
MTARLAQWQCEARFASGGVMLFGVTAGPGIRAAREVAGRVCPRAQSITVWSVPQASGPCKGSPDYRPCGYPADGRDQLCDLCRLDIHPEVP